MKKKYELVRILSVCKIAKKNKTIFLRAYLWHFWQQEDARVNMDNNELEPGTLGSSFQGKQQGLLVGSRIWRFKDH